MTAATTGAAAADGGAADGGALPDIASLAAGLGAALHTAGLPVGPDRCERLARALTVMNARSVAELHACALATLVSDPSQVGTFERVFARLFGTPPPFTNPVEAAESAFQRAEETGGPPAAQTRPDPGGWSAGAQITDTGASAGAGGRRSVGRAGCPAGGLGRRTAALPRLHPAVSRRTP